MAARSEVSKTKHRLVTQQSATKVVERHDTTEDTSNHTSEIHKEQTCDRALSGVHPRSSTGKPDVQALTRSMKTNHGRPIHVLGALLASASLVWTVGGVTVTLMAGVWAAVMQSVAPAMQWPIVMAELGKKLPPVLRKRARVNPACFIMLLVADLFPGASINSEVTWAPGERAKQLFEAARLFNQDVWVGTRHREVLTTKERGGDMTVETTLSIVSCGRQYYHDIPVAIIEAFGGSRNWVTAQDIPCGSVRMPRWLFTKPPLDAAQRRARQGLGNGDFSMDPYAYRAGLEFSSVWYSPFESVAVLSNIDGWTPPVKNESYSAGKIDPDYQRRALLKRRDGEMADGGINRIGFVWRESHYFIDYFSGMDTEACLDVTGTPSCRMGAPNGTEGFDYWFAYVPWLDKWTFNPSGLAAGSDSSCSSHTENPQSQRGGHVTREAEDAAIKEACLSQESESWERSRLDIAQLVAESHDGVGEKVDPASYEARLHNCPGDLILWPGNLSFIQIGQGDRWGDQFGKMLIDKARELQDRVYSRISKDGIVRTPTSTLFLTVVTGIEAVLAAASWEITLLVANLLVRSFPHWKVERKLRAVKYMSLFASLLLVAAAVTPAGFLLNEELGKTRDQRVDAEIEVDTSRRSNKEGNGFLGLVFVLTMEVRDSSSRYREGIAILATIAALGVWVVIKRVRDLSQPRGRLREAFIIVGAIEP